MLDAAGHLKLADFGFARAGVSKPAEGARSLCGTPDYMAPEIIDERGHGLSADWWGLGVITFEMLTGLPPWYRKKRDPIKLFARIRDAPLEVHCKRSKPLGTQGEAVRRTESVD